MSPTCFSHLLLCRCCATYYLLLSYLSPKSTYIRICGSQELSSHIISEGNYEKNAIKVYDRIRDKVLGTRIHIEYCCAEVQDFSFGLCWSE